MPLQWLMLDVRKGREDKVYVLQIQVSLRIWNGLVKLIDASVVV